MAEFEIGIQIKKYKPEKGKEKKDESYLGSESSFRPT
jgi:hypothetical protein